MKQTTIEVVPGESGLMIGYGTGPLDTEYIGKVYWTGYRELGGHLFNWDNDELFGSDSDNVVKLMEWLSNNGYPIPTDHSRGVLLGYVAAHQQMDRAATPE